MCSLSFSPTHFFSNIHFLAALVILSFVNTHTALACVEDHTVDFKLRHLSASVDANTDKIVCNDLFRCDLHFIACIKGVKYEADNDSCTQFYNGIDKNKVSSEDLHRGNLNRKYNAGEDELTLTLIVLDTDDDTAKSEYKNVYKEAKQRKLYGRVPTLWYEELILNTSAGSHQYSKSLFAIKHLISSYHNNTKIDINFDITITRVDCTTTAISTSSTNEKPAKASAINMQTILIGGFSVLGIICLAIVCFVRAHKTSRAKPSRKGKRTVHCSPRLPQTAYDMSVFQTTRIPMELPKQRKQRDTIQLKMDRRVAATWKKYVGQYNFSSSKPQDPTLRKQNTKVNQTVTEREPASIFASSINTKHPFRPLYDLNNKKQPRRCKLHRTSIDRAS